MAAANNEANSEQPTSSSDLFSSLPSARPRANNSKRKSSVPVAEDPSLPTVSALKSPAKPKTNAAAAKSPSGATQTVTGSEAFPEPPAPEPEQNTSKDNAEPISPVAAHLAGLVVGTARSAEKTLRGVLNPFRR